MVQGMIRAAGLIAGIVANSASVCAQVPVERDVQQAFERAVQRYPEPIRLRLEGIGLVRERDYGVPGDASLMVRLLGDAAYAYFEAVRERVVVLDAGVAGRATWRGGDASRDDVAGLMSDLANVLDAPPGDIEAQWAAFVAIVQNWEEEDPIRGEIRLGDERVLDRFVRLGVSRALGGEMDRAGLMVHELAHAVQLSGRLGDAVSRMEAWGGLSGWARADNGEPFNGIWGWGIRMEEPAVLGRLLVGGDRGEGLYAHAPGARFVNLYAAYDAREDYAESVRLFIEDPDRLLAIAPEKFLFINAVGYNDRLDVSEPGPLWIGEAAIVERGWQDAVQVASAELLSGREGISVDPRTMAALLRAHAGVLRADGLPRMDVAMRMPRDVPQRVRENAPLKDFVVEIGGERFGPSREAVLRVWEELAVQRLHELDFERNMRSMLGVDDVWIREMREADPGLGPEERASRTDAVLSIRVDAPDPEMVAGRVREEIRLLEEAKRPMLARAVALRLAMLMDDDAALDEKIRSTREYLSRVPGGYDAAELGRVLVDAMLQRGDVIGAVGVADGIMGELWGLLRRVEALCAIARTSRDKVWLERAEGEIERSGRGENSPVWREGWRMIRDGEHELRENRSDD